MSRFFVRVEPTGRDDDLARCVCQSLAGVAHQIHRDLLVGPQSDPDQTSLLHDDWAGALRKLFTRYTPLFLGYGGNDGSLMNFLDELRPGEIPGGIFW